MSMYLCMYACMYIKINKYIYSALLAIGQLFICIPTHSNFSKYLAFFIIFLGYVKKILIIYFTVE